MLEIGSVLDGKYKILDQIGKGGMSVVYLARNEKLAQNCAIKEVRKDGVKDFEIVKQGLVAETDILKKLKHPSLPMIMDIIDTEDSFVIVMELIDGKSMDKTLEEHGALPEAYVVEWAKQICDVFQYLHTRKPPIIYRDMKPSNIMLKPDGSICIIDFGTAREFKERNVKDTTTLGTVGYAAPEQYGGAGQRQSDARTDIYTLGATIYHLVTGYSPNPSAPPYYGMVPIRQINPTLSTGLEKVILKCCQQKPEDRYQDCLEVIYALNHIEDDEVQDKKRFKLFLTTSALCLVMALAGTGFLVASNQQKSENFSSLIELATDGTIQTSNEDRLAYCRSAIALEPGNMEGYEALLSVISSTDACCEDSNITAEEATALELISTNRASLIAASASDYGKLCYDVGHAIWFNYRNDLDDETAKMKQAIGWFRDAQNNLDESSEYYNLAQLYYQIGDYNMNIQQSIDQDDDKGKYLEYWNTMSDMLELASSETNYAQLQMYRLAVNSVQLYAKSFVNDGVTSEQMLSMLDEVETGLDRLSNQFTEGTNSEICQNTIQSLAMARTNAQLVG
jgi:serine/threonine-protein kinase